LKTCDWLFEPAFHNTNTNAANSDPIYIVVPLKKLKTLDGDLIDHPLVDLSFDNSH
jgi:hypothetical protein